MPPVKAVHGNPAARCTAHLPPPLSAYPLPPALVTSKGESLDEHTARTSPDFVSSLSIMIHVTTVVGRLHDAGWVHRDLKPTNAVFLPQQARWALVDFGCAARRGAHALPWHAGVAAGSHVHACAAATSPWREVASWVCRLCIAASVNCRLFGGRGRFE